MSRPVRLLLVACVSLAAVLAVSGCSSTDSGDKGYVEAGGTITKLPVAQRRTPGPVSGTTLDGHQLSLQQYAGKVVVLNVWGSWCAPCRKEAPTLVAAAHDLSKQGVVFLGVNTKDASVDNARAFQRRYGVTYPSFFDPSGRTLLAFHRTLPPSAIPSTVVIDKQGRVAASILGEVPTTRTLVDLVKDVES